MAKSNIPQGKMVLHFNPETMDKPKVWVKVESDNEEPSLFLNNEALVRFSISSMNKPRIDERWLITDEFYGKMVRMGLFVPIDDLNQVDSITEELGWPTYEIDLPF